MSTILTSESIQRIHNFITEECGSTYCEISLDVHGSPDIHAGIKERERIFTPNNCISVTIKFDVNRVIFNKR